MVEIKKLIEGYKKFHNSVVSDKNDIFKGIQTSQNPETLIICCSDSRVDPAILTNAEIGDIFVVRNVANLVPTYQPKWDSNHGTSAAIEFAVNHLHVSNIVVLGHSNCGGIKTLVDSDIDINQEFSFINNWIEIADEVKKTIPDDVADKYTFCEQECIKLSLSNLMTFPWIKKKVENKELQLHGWYFSLKNASLAILNEDNNVFEEVEV